MFVAVAEPTRRAILDMLADGERPAGDLVAAFPSLTQPAVSRHLRVLLEAGLVNVRPDAQRRIYTLQPARLAEMDVWMTRYRKFWSERLIALGQHLDQTRSAANLAAQPATKASPATPITPTTKNKRKTSR